MHCMFERVREREEKLSNERDDKNYVEIKAVCISVSTIGCVPI